MSGPAVVAGGESFSSLHEGFVNYQGQLASNGDTVVFFDSSSPEGLARIIAENLPPDGKRLIVVTKEPSTPPSLRRSGATYNEMEANGGVESPYAVVEAGLPSNLRGRLEYRTLGSIRFNGAGIVGRLEVTVAHQQPAETKTRI